MVVNNKKEVLRGDVFDFINNSHRTPKENATPA
jgi:hypothetical protein